MPYPYRLLIGSQYHLDPVHAQPRPSRAKENAFPSEAPEIWVEPRIVQNKECVSILPCMLDGVVELIERLRSMKRGGTSINH